MGSPSLIGTHRELRARDMKTTLGTAAAIALAFTGAAFAQASAVDKNYVKSLAAPGKTVLVIEYYDGNGKVVERKGFASTSGYKATSPTSFSAGKDLSINLYGIKPCDGDFVNRKEDYSGSCAEFAKDQLGTMLQSPKVLFCRAFLTEMNAPKQEATCYGYYNYPGAMDSVDNLESQLLSLGAVKLDTDKNGKPQRPDLLNDEKIGKEGQFGMWADSRSAQ